MLFRQAFYSLQLSSIMFFKAHLRFLFFLLTRLKHTVSHEVKYGTSSGNAKTENHSAEKSTTWALNASLMEKHFKLFYKLNLSPTPFLCASALWLFICSDIVPWCFAVALNFQSLGLPMDLNDGRFQDNGGCGYVLKPVVLMSSERSFDPSCSQHRLKPTHLLLKVQLWSTQC